MLDINEALHRHVSHEPPLHLTSQDVLTAGRRSVRRHRLLVGLAGAATAAVVVLGVATAPRVLAYFADGRQQIVGAHDAATCAPLRGTTPPDDISSEEAASRLSCYLLDAVPALFPAGTTFADNPQRSGTTALVASRDPMGMDGDLAATAMVTDAEGSGLVLVSVARGQRPADFASHCAGPEAKARCETGPHGEDIEIYDFGADAAGVHSCTVQVYVGNTRILAGATNGPEVDGAEPTRPQPILTTEQLIDLATSPALLLYP